MGVQRPSTSFYADVSQGPQGTPFFFPFFLPSKRNYLEPFLFLPPQVKATSSFYFFLAPEIRHALFFRPPILV